jgi:hypothetical protein
MIVRPRSLNGRASICSVEGHWFGSSSMLRLISLFVHFQFFQISLLEFYSDLKIFFSDLQRRLFCSSSTPESISAILAFNFLALVSKFVDGAVENPKVTLCFSSREW